MHFAVIGDTGMFGREMVNLLTNSAHTVRGFNRTNFRIENSPEDLASDLKGFDFIINAVGYTNVNLAESDEGNANRINGNFAGNLALASRISGARLAHISSDYVFDGRAQRPYTINDIPNPESAYGRSKLLGENLVSKSGADYVIFRTAWLYGAFGNCFPNRVIRDSLEGRPLRIVYDQIGQPTWARDLADQVLAYLSLPTPPRIVHAVSSGRASWYEFAKEILGEYPVEPISSASYSSTAKRPAWSVLDNSSNAVEPIADWKTRWNVAKPLINMNLD